MRRLFTRALIEALNRPGRLRGGWVSPAATEGVPVLLSPGRHFESREDMERYLAGEDDPDDDYDDQRPTFC